MDAQLKAKWIAALRSGKYEQGHSCLRSFDAKNFCCLGVLLDIQSAQWDGSSAQLGETYVMGLETPPPQVLGELLTDKANDLISMNDGTDGVEKHSFAEIADYIEKNL